MKPFLTFLTVPLIIGGGVMLTPWLTREIIQPGEAISVPQLTLPPGAREVAGQSSAVDEPLRLEALMPAFMIDSVIPPPPSPVKRSAAERFQLASVLLSPEKRSAVINGQVVFEGSRMQGYRVQRIGKDQVALSGPDGVETISLNNRPLFLAAKKDNDKMQVLVPKRPPEGTPAQPALPADELERQFRHLLENFSH